MARSLYKGERLGKRPPCLICMGPGEGERAQLHLPYGVSVWLCGAHRSAEFQARRAGRDFVASLWRAWEAAGCLTKARSRALEAHRARVLGQGGPRSRPGSYSWPALRREAEARFAAGEAPGRVMRELRERALGGAAVPPSRRTLRRWFQEGRWLGGPPAPGPPPRPPEAPSGRAGREDPVGVAGDLVAAPAGGAGQGGAGGEGIRPAGVLVLDDGGQGDLAANPTGLHDDRSLGEATTPPE